MLKMGSSHSLFDEGFLRWIHPANISIREMPKCKSWLGHIYYLTGIWAWLLRDSFQSCLMQAANTSTVASWALFLVVTDILIILHIGHFTAPSLHVKHNVWIWCYERLLKRILLLTETCINQPQMTRSLFTCHKVEPLGGNKYPLVDKYKHRS